MTTRSDVQARLAELARRPRGAERPAEEDLAWIEAEGQRIYVA